MTTPKEDVKATKESRFVVVEVATETQPVISDNDNDEKHDLYSAIANIMNDLEMLKKALL